MKKYQFRIHQTVAFIPEEGVLRDGIVIAAHAYSTGTRRNGEPGEKRLAYTVQEPDGTLWNCEECELFELTPIEEQVNDGPEPDPEAKQTAQHEPLYNRFFVQAISTRAYNCLRRTACETVWDLILFAQDKDRMKLRGYGKKTDAELRQWLDKYWPGWRKMR